MAVTNSQNHERETFSLSPWEMRITLSALKVQEETLRSTRLADNERPSERAVHLAEIVRLQDRMKRCLARAEDDG